MTPPYPERLLPKSYYHTIKDFQPLAGRYLQRMMPDNDFLLEDGEIDAGKVKVSATSQNMQDLSTNLIGTFLPNDRSFEWTAEGKLEYTPGWVSSEDEVVPPVADQHYTINDGKGQIFIPIGECLTYEVPYNIGEEDGFTAYCHVLHTPIRGNFWHVSLRWFDEDGNVLNADKGWKKRMLGTARALIVEKGILSLDEVAEIPPQLYITTQEEA